MFRPMIHPKNFFGVQCKAGVEVYYSFFPLEYPIVVTSFVEKIFSSMNSLNALAENLLTISQLSIF